MIAPVDALSLVVAQAPEAARVQAASQNHAALANAGIPAVIAQLENTLRAVASVHAVLRSSSSDTSGEHRGTGWTYSRHPHKQALADAGASDGFRVVGTLIDLAA